MIEYDATEGVVCRQRVSLYLKVTDAGQVSSLNAADEVTFRRGGDAGVVEAGGEVRDAGRVRIVGLTDRLSGSDRVWHKGRPGPFG